MRIANYLVPMHMLNGYVRSRIHVASCSSCSPCMAEPATEEVTDEFRMLTNDGREALRESFFSDIFQHCVFLIVQRLGLVLRSVQGKLVISLCLQQDAIFLISIARSMSRI